MKPTWYGYEYFFKCRGDKNIDPTFIYNMYQTKEPVEAKNIPLPKLPDENKHMIFSSKDGEQTIPVYYEMETQQLHAVTKNFAYGIEPRNIEQRFALHALLNPQVPLVSITGKAEENFTCPCSCFRDGMNLIIFCWRAQ